MTGNEAVEILKNNFPKTCKMVDGRYKGGFDDTECEFGQALLLSISALEEIQQYKAAEKSVIEILEKYVEYAEQKAAANMELESLYESGESGKQQGKKVKNRKLRSFNGTPYSVQGDCPSCGWEGLLSMNTNYCNACGQKLDWSE